VNLEDQYDQTDALQVPCPPRNQRGCGQPAGELCLNLGTGEPLQNLPAHYVRLLAAGVEFKPTDDRDRRRDPDRWSA
jgi:hypothetical protein